MSELSILMKGIAIGMVLGVAIKELVEITLLKKRHAEALARRKMLMEAEEQIRRLRERLGGHARVIAQEERRCCYANLCSLLFKLSSSRD